MTAMPMVTTAALTMALAMALTMALTKALTMALTIALTTAGLLHRARRVHRRPAARLLLRARRHAPPARALLRRGQPHRAPTLALSLSLSLALALNLVATLALIRAPDPSLTLTYRAVWHLRSWAAAERCLTYSARLAPRQLQAEQRRHRPGVITSPAQRRGHAEGAVLSVLSGA